MNAQPTPKNMTHRAVSPLTVLWCGALIMTITLGIRHSFGLFLQPMSLSNGWGREVFAFSIALQNLTWGLAQPFVGRIADRLGAGIAMFAGGMLYAIGLILMSQSESAGMLSLSAGVLIGLGLSGTTFPVVFGAIAKSMPPEKRSMAMGISMALGSLGQFAFLPGGLVLINQLGWEWALLVLSVVVGAVIPLSWPLLEKRKAGNSRADGANALADQELGMWQTLRHAMRHKGFLLLSSGYFVCGFQVIFISVHLPSYIQDQGVAATAGSNALALIGLFNILGSYLAGRWGARFRKPLLLTGIYSLRAVLIVAFIVFPLSEMSVYLFAAGMGILWLSTVPLTSGTVSTMFGAHNLGMLGGLVFLFHQLGAFVGGWAGGLLFDATGSYTVAWLICIGLSLVAAAVSWPVQERAAPFSTKATHANQ